VVVACVDEGNTLELLEGFPNRRIPDGRGAVGPGPPGGPPSPYDQQSSERAVRLQWRAAPERREGSDADLDEIVDNPGELAPDDPREGLVRVVPLLRTAAELHRQELPWASLGGAERRRSIYRVAPDVGPAASRSGVVPRRRHP